MVKKSKTQNPKIGTCRLCLQEKELISAHIISDFFYRKMRKADGKLFSMDAVKAYQSFDTISFANARGHFDDNILCDDCDRGILGKYETYASRILERQSKIDYRSPTITVTNVDYTNFKLFLLATLWRASITNHVFFQAVYLGVHEDVIREMLYNHDAGKIGDYPTLILDYKFAEGAAEVMELIGQPIKRRIEGRIGYIFIVYGKVIVYLMSREFNLSNSSFFLDKTINPKGQMEWFLVTENALGFLQRIIGIGMPRRSV